MKRRLALLLSAALLLSCLSGTALALEPQLGEMFSTCEICDPGKLIVNYANPDNFGHDIRAICDSCDNSVPIRWEEHDIDGTTCLGTVCPVCNYRYRNYGKHDSSCTLQWTTTATTHMKAWSGCGKVEVKETAHSWSNGECTVCNYECAHDSYNAGACTYCGSRCPNAPEGATCTKAAFCTGCASSHTNPAVHDSSCTLQWISTSATTHKQAYSGCGKVVVAEAAHRWNKPTGVCSDCKYACTHDDGKNEKIWVSGGVDTHFLTWSCCGSYVDDNLIPHKWNDGKCSDCGAVCRHNWVNGVCAFCDLECTHDWADGVCTICELECAHDWADGVCEICELECTHDWADGVCTICELECTHDWADGVCTICELECTHDWADGICTICELECTHETAVTDAKKAPSCTASGLTEGSHCAVCGKTLKAQQRVKALGHWYGEWTANGDGTHSATCLREGCGHVGTVECAAVELRPIADENENAQAHVLCPVCGELDEGLRLELVKDAMAVSETRPKGELALRVGALRDEEMLMSLCFEYGGRMTRYVGEVEIVLPAVLVEGRSLTLIAADGTETGLPYTVDGDEALFALEFADVEAEAALALIRLVPAE